MIIRVMDHSNDSILARVYALASKSNSNDGSEVFSSDSLSSEIHCMNAFQDLWIVRGRS